MKRQINSSEYSNAQPYLAAKKEVDVLREIGVMLGETKDLRIVPPAPYVESIHCKKGGPQGRPFLLRSGLLALPFQFIVDLIAETQVDVFEILLLSRERVEESTSCSC